MVTFAKEKTSVILEDVSWDFYTHTLHEIGHGATRIVFDDGRMEIMTVSNDHERAKKAMARLLEAYADALGVEVEGVGNVTLRREDLGKGLEPDECYYVSSVQPPVSSSGMDIVNYPPPDLALEVEITRGILSKRAIYARLGVPELWRWDGAVLRLARLDDDGQYRDVGQSRYFPDFDVTAFSKYLRLALEKNQTIAVRAWREWLRK